MNRDGRPLPEPEGARSLAHPGSLIPWIAASSLAVCAGLLGWFYLEAQNDNRLLKEGASVAEVDRQRLLVNLESEQAVSGRLLSDLMQARDLSRLRIAWLTPPAKPSQGSPLPASPEGGPPEGSPRAIALWNSTAQEGLLEVSGLPATTPGQHYQLWLIDPAQPQPVNGASFSIPSEGRNTPLRIRIQPGPTVGTIRAFSITLEGTDGRPGQPGPVVLGGE